MSLNLLGKSAKRMIRRLGMPLTVTTRAAAQGGTPTTRTIYFLPQPISEQYQMPDYLVEGNTNVKQGVQTNFKCAGDESIHEVTDYITYNSFYWRVSRVVPMNPYKGTPTSLTVVCVRQEALA